MEIKTFFDPEKAIKAHEGTILAGPVLPEGLKAPFDHAWGYLDAPGEMEYHKHNKEEIYFFFKGTGFVRIDGEDIPVVPGGASCMTWKPKPLILTGECSLMSSTVLT